MRILLVAPPWISVPPPSYGGTEAVIDYLATALSELGHEVALFTTGDSTCPVERSSFFPVALGFGQLNAADEPAHVAAAREFQRKWSPDVVHDHTFTGALLPAGRPKVVTNHWVFDDATNEIFRFDPRANVVAISNAQASTAGRNVHVAAVVHHGLNLEQINVGNGDGDYLAFLGRMAPEKGVERAIEISKQVDMPLKIAAKMTERREMEFFETRVAPLLDQDREFIGEVNQSEKFDFLGKAKALLNPINWDEPFGMVMVESLAVGTPVVSTPRGSAPEIVRDGVDGFIAATDPDLCDGIRRISNIDRNGCRSRVQEDFSSERMALEYEKIYVSVTA